MIPSTLTSHEISDQMYIFIGFTKDNPVFTFLSMALFMTSNGHSHLPLRRMKLSSFNNPRGFKIAFDLRTKRRNYNAHQKQQTELKTF